jgi:predicted DNA-binding transcriptional regulator AlpA
VRQLPEIGFLRLPQVLTYIPVSKSCWWAGVREGRYPQPTRALGPRITAWTCESIREFCERSAPPAANDDRQLGASPAMRQRSARGGRHGHV